MPRRVIAGLGNPGPRYAETRHNVGFDVALRVVEATGARRLEGTHRAYDAWVAPGADGTEIAIVLPLLFMNRSGDALAEFRREHAFEPADCLVIVDDVYLPLGRIRLRAGGSPGGHNGLASVSASFETHDFPRLRIGVGRGDPDGDLAEHVLGTFDDDELDALTEMLDRSAGAALAWAGEGITAAMNRYNVPAQNAQDDTTPQGER